MRTNRVQWLLLASALCAAQGIMTGCSSCGDGDRKPRIDGGAGEDSGMDEDGSTGPDAGGAAGIRVEPKAGLVTTEQGGQAAFAVVLTGRPSANVTVGLSSSDESEGTLKVASLVFTASNWSAPQQVTVTGMDDDAIDGNAEYTIRTAAAVSDDTAYSGLDADDVTVSNTDDETAGVTVTAAAGLETNEDGTSVTFTIALNAMPESNVTIALSSSDVGEGTVGPAALTFTTGNWAAAQVVTVTGVDDSEADGPQTFSIVTAATSADSDYEGIEVADVTIANADNDGPGFRIAPLTGLRTNENGDQATFTVALNSRPAAPVTIGLVSGDVGEVSLASASLTFTPDNWDGLQTVILTGVNDDDADGNQVFQIITQAATSADPLYQALNPADLSGINVDNDLAGVTVRLPDPLRTAEDGTQATFTVELNARPTGDVTISFASPDTDEVAIAPASLVFTQADWNSRKPVTLSGVDDDSRDGEQTFTITVTSASGDAAYNALDIANIVGRNVDNDSAGVTVTAVSRNARENGQQAQFSVRLNSRPSSNVVVGVSSSDTAEVTVSSDSLVFTPADWNSAHVVTLTGVNDNVIDGNRSVVIALADTVSADPDYNAISVPDVDVINEDDDTPGLRVSKVDGLVTTESGGQDSFTIALATQPSANVRLTVSSSNSAEATVSSGLLTFTPANWNAPQEITVTGQNDAIADGAQPYFVVLGPTDSADANYLGLAALNVSGTNTDNDSAGITVAGATGLVTAESGTQQSFTVVLNSEPVGDVTIPIVSLTPTEGTAAPASLVFTAGNWSSPQTVFVTGLNDDIEDGSQQYAIRIGPSASSDTSYVNVPVPNVVVTNTDNDTAGITVAPLSLLEVSEGGTQDSFTVVLDSQPTANVTIAISSSNPAEATVGSASLTFTSANWASAQTVLVTGRGDLIQDGDQDFAIHIGPAASADARYAGRAVPDLSGTNQDIDSPAIRITGSGLTTTEAGGQTSFTVVLLRAPTADVTLPIVTSDATEGTASPALLTFTSANWDGPQVVTVTGINDDVEDGNQPYFILVGPAVSTDVNYGGRVVPNVRVTNNDNDTAGVTLADTAGLTTSETPPGQDTFTIVLNSEPTSNVVFNLTSNDITEGTVSPATITFTPVNWNAPQTVTITGVNDNVQDGSPTYQIVMGSPTTSDARYAAQVVPNVTVTNLDNDTAGINVVAAALTTTEAGATASFTVVLNSEPTVDVVLPIASNDTTEGTLSAPSLTFTAGNWNVPQPVTVTGVDDFVQDGPQAYAVVFGAVASGDPNYAALTPPASLPVSNTDNDTAGITVVSPGGGLTTTEAGVTATFTVVLNSQPAGGASVALALASSDISEATVAPLPGLVFTAANWNVPQTVTVTGINDNVADGNQPFAITIGPAASTDGLYDTSTVPDILGTNTDNDSPGFVLSTSSITTYEFDVSTTFTVRLTSEPTADVLIGLQGSVVAEATVAPASLTFTAANWNVDQTVTVTGVDDALLDGAKAYVIVLAAVVSTDLVYNGLNPSDVTGTNVEAAYSCDEWLTRHPSFTSGIYPLDTDRTGPNPVFDAYCDMATDGGGWTLLSWTADSEVGIQGAPYPGLAYCSAFDCVRGSGVPTSSVDALFDVSGELAQGQTTSLALQATFGLLGSYEFAGSYMYGSLAALALDTGAGGCAGVATGTYNDLVNTAASDGVPVFLNSGLRRDDNPAFANFTVDSNTTVYQWSLGNRGDYCTLNGVAPSSFLGTFDDGQYGPGVPTAAGSYSVWVR